MIEGLKNAFGLEGKTVFITGGGSGLGLAMAECLTAAGARTIIAGRRKELLQQACRRLGDKASWVEYDVTGTGEAGKVIEKIAYALTQAALPYMRKQKSGSIIFISSMSAYIGLTNVTAYSAAKSAVLGLVKTLSGEVAEDGIRVNAIVPGFIDTPMFRQVVDQDLPRQEKILGHTPMKRYGTPEDIGWASVYLASEASKFVTGTALMVDGGCAIGF